jgi:hypothetical protein
LPDGELLETETVACHAAKLRVILERDKKKDVKQALSQGKIVILHAK